VDEIAQDSVVFDTPVDFIAIPVALDDEVDGDVDELVVPVEVFVDQFLQNVVEDVDEVDEIVDEFVAHVLDSIQVAADFPQLVVESWDDDDDICEICDYAQLFDAPPVVVPGTDRLRTLLGVGL
jgi:hypothetical protein